MRIHRSLYFQKPKPEVERYSLDTLLEIRTLYADAGASNVSVMFEQTGSSYGNLELIATFDSYAHLGEVSKHQRNHRRLQEIKERPGSTGLELVSSWTSDIVAIFGWSWEMDPFELEKYTILHEFHFGLNSSDYESLRRYTEPYVGDLFEKTGAVTGMRVVTAGTPPDVRSTGPIGTIGIWQKDWASVERTVECLRESGFMTNHAAGNANPLVTAGSRILTRLEIEGHLA